jgi:membrane-bound serine protease (ClpP class)
MKKLTTFFLFILDELIFVSLIISLMYFLNVSIEIFATVTILIIIALFFISYIFLPQLKKPTTGKEGLIGMNGVALETFEKQGIVLVRGEQWKAITHDDIIEKDDEIIILDVHGLTVTVEKI